MVTVSCVTVYRRYWLLTVEFVGWLVLRATAARNSSTSELEPGVFCTFWPFKRASRCSFSASELKEVVRPSVFLAFWLGNVLCAAAACNFSFLLRPHDSASAALASLLFDPPVPRVIGKTHRFANFLTFRATVSSLFWLLRTCVFSFFWIYFFALRCFCPYCRKLDF